MDLSVDEGIVPLESLAVIVGIIVVWVEAQSTAEIFLVLDRSVVVFRSVIGFDQTSDYGSLREGFQKTIQVIYWVIWAIKVG